jgi:tetratricopeptide (TPR) repeat protein
MNDRNTVDGPTVVERETFRYEARKLFEARGYDGVRARFTELTEHGDPSIQAAAWLNLSYVSYNVGEYEEALRAARESFHTYHALVPDIPNQDNPRVKQALADEHDAYVMQTLALWQMGGAEPTRLAAAMGDRLVAPSTSFDKEVLETIRLRLLLDVDDLERANKLIEKDSPDFGDMAMLEVTWNARAFEAMTRLARGVPKSSVEESVARRFINVRRPILHARQPFVNSAKMYLSRAQELLKSAHEQATHGVIPESFRTGFIDPIQLLNQLEEGLKHWRKARST